MLRWGLVGAVAALVCFAVQLITLKTVFGADKGNQATSRAKEAIERANRTRSDFSGGSRSFSRPETKGSDPRSFSPRNVEPSSNGSRGFNSRSNNSSQPRSNDFTPNRQSQNRQRVETFRQPTSNDAPFQFGGQKDTQPFNALQRGNDRATDMIRKAPERGGVGSTGKTGDTTRFDRSASDRSRFDSPKLGRPTSGSSKFDKTNISTPGDGIGNNSSNRLARPNSDMRRDNLSNNVRDARDRANIQRDLKLGGSTKPNDPFKDTGREPNFDRQSGFDRKTDIERLSGSDRFKDLNRKAGGDTKFNRDQVNRLHNDLQRERLHKTGRPVIDDATAARLTKQNWLDKSDRRRYDQLVRAPQIDKLNLDKQFRLHDRGDITRRMNFQKDLMRNGGWQHRNVGFVSPAYRNFCSYRNYYGPSWFPRRCWYPVWNNWVNWSWNFSCDPWYDPRPVFCRPVYYAPSPAWVAWQYPAWNPLPVVASGTWVDVQKVVVNDGVDVQLLAVRFVDAGHLDQNLGPRYRVWIQNNSNFDIDQPFNVVLMGNNDALPDDVRLEVGQRVPNLAAGQMQAVDLRLPLTPNGVPGEPFAFSNVHVLVDAHRELQDINVANNGAVIDRGEILPVDPALFNADNDVIESGMVLNVAGEGLGPEPGQVLLHVNGITYQPEILGWYDLGVQLRVPQIAVAGLTTADLVVVRGDGAAANPLPMQIANAAAGRDF